MKFVIGGRSLETTYDQVVEAVAGQEPDAIRKHQVQIEGVEFPLKQVLGSVSGWDRKSFTTQEAKRVLEKLGFKCRKVREQAPDPETNDDAPGDESESGDALDVVHASLEVLQMAVAELARRVSALEKGES